MNSSAKIYILNWYGCWLSEKIHITKPLFQTLKHVLLAKNFLGTKDKLSLHWSLVSTAIVIVSISRQVQSPPIMTESISGRDYAGN